MPTGVRVLATRTFRRGVPKSGSVRCLACHRRHMWDRYETFLEGTTASHRRDGMVEPRPPAIRYVLGRDLPRS